ncbi:hypothetical protein O6H91_15G075700 [Diphasiastrum complanatum]|uniref:Uncharacterized protein n=1 Tax=Diphasiastrum complanatum TaxID=34168 RepID=A0ACC2BJW4_DIPCM|nr:hypothetical protein O6H91_15G075700 [Diphasiastrum complanatum]
MGSLDSEWPGPETDILPGSDGNTRLASWWESLRMQMRLLRSALNGTSSGSQLDLELKKLLSDCLNFYIASSEICFDKVICDFISGQHSASLEAAFMWLGGWRPTSALMLVHFVLSGHSQGEQASTPAPEIRTSALSDKQLSNINNLQKHTQQAENELSYQFAIFQMLVADQTMVKAFVSEAGASKNDYSEAYKAVESKIENLGELLRQAEKLRLQTLKELFNLLTPVQAARCSTTAFELVFSLKALSTTRFGASFSVHKKFQSTKTAFSLSDSYDVQRPSESVANKPSAFSAVNTSMEPHSQDAAEKRQGDCSRTCSRYMEAPSEVASCCV